MPKALVIDDEVELTEIVSRFLSAAGFRVETATSGAEGVRKAISMRPDVAIVDVMMPEIDGYKVCRRLRSDPRTSRTVIMVLTARGQPIDKEIAFRAGADVHMTKPFKGKALIQEIQELLADRSPTAPTLGYQTCVLRLKAGVGATTVATNLALSLAQEKGQLAVAADLVFQGGQIENRLGLPLTRSWPETFADDDDRLVDCLVRHESGLFVLPSPPPGVGQLDPEVIATILQTLRGWHDHVVVDTPFNLGALAPVLLRSSPLVLLLLTPDASVLQAAQASVTAIRRSGNRSLQIWPVLNMMGPDQQSFPQEVEEALELPVAAVIPWSPEECAQAITNCQPAVLGRPDSPMARSFQSLAQGVVQALDGGPLRRIPG